MKKLLAMLCTLALIMGLFAVPAMAEGKPFRILMVCTTGVDDGNFNQDIYSGIQAFLADHPDCSVKDITLANKSRQI